MGVQSEPERGGRGLEGRETDTRREGKEKKRTLCTQNTQGQKHIKGKVTESRAETENRENQN